MDAILATGSRERRAEAMGQADGHLVAALLANQRLYEQKRSDTRRGGSIDPWQEITTYTNMLLHHVRALTPDMNDHELRERHRLLLGLEDSLRFGVGGRWEPGMTASSVDHQRLQAAWHNYLLGLTPPGEHGLPSALNLGDPPIAVRATARVLPATGEPQQWDLGVGLRWERTFTVWPRERSRHLVIYPAEPFAEVFHPASDRPLQDQMGRERSLRPVTREDRMEALFHAYGPTLAAWKPEQAVALRVLEGLDQQIYLRVRTGSAQPPHMEVILLERSPDGSVRAVPVPVN